MNIFSDENRKKIVNGLFYLALTIELVLMIVEKSEISFSYESYVFRLTFVITLLAVLVMKHNRKEWIAVALLLAFTALCYYLSGKNDLLRVATFLMAARDIDLKKAMKYSFYVSVAGFLMIILAASIGVMGDIALTYDYGRDVGVETRYVFGFGHPNTLFSSAFAIIIMWLWLYGKKAGVLAYVTLIMSSAILVYITRTKTGMLILTAIFIVAVIIRRRSELGDKKSMYILGSMVSPVLCLLFSIGAAAISDYQYVGPGMPKNKLANIFWKIEDELNYRISNLYYGTEDRGGTISRWKLFAGHGSDSFFDMGWVRLFYWYGIIPTILIVAALVAIILVCWKKRDIWTMVLIFSVSVYTMVEATFVTRYIGRDFFLLIAGVYLGYYLKDKGESDVGTA